LGAINENDGRLIKPSETQKMDKDDNDDDDDKYYDDWD
jgi:hypothetical protein